MTIGLVVLGLALAGGLSSENPEATLPVIVGVLAPDRLLVGASAEIRILYRAPGANVVAIVQIVEDLDGALAHRMTRQREFGVVARAFGREAGELVVPVSFGTVGRKRVTLTLVTDERAESDPAMIEVEAVP